MTVSSHPATPSPEPTTRVTVGVVDVVVLAPAPVGARSRWQLLMLRRAPGLR